MFTDILANPMIQGSVYGLLVGLGVGSFIYKMKNKTKKQHDADYIKSIYGVYITILEEYKNYFMKYELGRYTFIKNNEILQDEYNNLVRNYVKLFFELYGESEAVQEIIDIKYGNKEAFVKFLIHDFDILLFDNQILTKDHLKNIYEARIN